MPQRARQVSINSQSEPGVAQEQARKDQHIDDRDPDID